MAKKKKRRRPPAKPAPEPEQQRSARAERKEQARLERERRIRSIRRRRLLKRGGIVLGVVAVIGGITGWILYNNARESRRDEEVAAIASRIGCNEIQEDLADEGANHVEQPPTYQTVPASSGNHAPSPLPPDVSVYDDPFDPIAEFRAVHNLEHGYVLMYYRGEGEGALARDAVDELADLAEGEEEVILAPYGNLPEGENLVFVSWTNMRRCTADGPAGDVREVAEHFIERFRNNADAPEAAAA